ncbi:LysR family transcriptional regulator [Streptomyces sp. A30]|uniref:LysR family transcriptional regulator n=1 Tax=Streptomyces sp. A30 TaxID=2789273 RepID=UPI00397F59E0
MLPDLKQLAYWLAVVEEGSLTRAAKRLSISQPWLSQQIRALERDLGGDLLERLPHGVQPTPAGRALLPEARAVVAAAEHARQTVREALGLEGGTLEVGALVSHLTGPLLASIEQWHDRHRAVPMEIHCFKGRLLLQEGVARGLTDLGIAPRPARWDGPIVVLGWDEIVAVLPADDPLLRARDLIRLDELADRPFVLYERDFGPAESVLVACGNAGFQPRGVVSTPGVEAAARLAAAGLGVALVPAWNVPPELKPSTRRLTPPIGAELTAFTRTSWSPAATAYLAILREQPWPAKPADAVELNPRLIEH